MDPGFLPPCFAAPPFALGVCLMPRLRSKSAPLAPPCLAAAAPRRPAAPPEPSHAQQYARHLWPCQGCPCPGFRDC